MKTSIKILLTSLGTVACGLSALAQSGAEMKSPSMGYLDKASKIIGSEVRNIEGEKLGKVKDLDVQLASGRITEVLVGTGGVLGVDEKVVAVQPAQFSYDEASRTLRLNADKEWLKNAPNLRDTAAMSDQGNGYMERASKIIGMRVHNSQNQTVGKVDNLIVDLPSARVAEVILSSGGFMGMGHAMSEVPPESFQYDLNHKRLTLDTTREALASAPHYDSSDLPDWNNSTHVRGVYQAYNTPYYGPNNDSGQNKRDRNGATLTAQSQKNDKSDVDITREIRRQIIAARRLSVDARNVKIITVDGRVTLRGPVASDDERNTISQIAASVVPADNVDNQLQLKNASSATSSTTSTQ